MRVSEKIFHCPKQVHQTHSKALINQENSTTSLNESSSVIVILHQNG